MSVWGWPILPLIHGTCWYNVVVSQKLYAKATYSPNFSEKWCLSVNIEETPDTTREE